MNIEVAAQVNAAELNELFSTNNWQVDDVDKLARSLENCWCYLTARDPDGRLVGFVQAISDGIMHVYILRMIVRPEFRNLGIGSKIMDRLMKKIEGERLKPTLVDTPGNDKFYEKFGFRSECKGMKALCIR